MAEMTYAAQFEMQSGNSIPNDAVDHSSSSSGLDAAPSFPGALGGQPPRRRVGQPADPPESMAHSIDNPLLARLTPPELHQRPWLGVPGTSPATRLQTSQTVGIDPALEEMLRRATRALSPTLTMRGSEVSLERTAEGILYLAGMIAQLKQRVVRLEQHNSELVRWLWSET